MVHTKMHLTPTWSTLVSNLLNDATHTERIWQSKSHFPKTNIKEHENNFELQLCVPGIAKANVKVAIDKNVLHISYEHDSQNPSDTATKILQEEFSIDSFSRKFTLGKNIDASSITAKYDNGILHVLLGKKQEEPSLATNIEVA